MELQPQKSRNEIISSLADGKFLQGVTSAADANGVQRKGNEK